MDTGWTRVAAALIAAAGAAAATGAAKDTKAELQRDLKDTDIVGDWNYDDIDGAFLRAAREKKPVCVVFR